MFIVSQGATQKGSWDMDPNANLAEMRRLAQAMLAHESDDVDDVDRLAELVVGLDEFLSSGGFPPDAWNDVPKGILLSTETLSRWAGRDLDETDVHRLRREIPESDVPGVVRGLLGDEYRCEPPLLHGDALATVDVERLASADDTRLSMFTVIGAWQGDEPIVVGVVAGEHSVSGGDSGYWDEGVWATVVECGDAEEAEALAVAEMMAETESAEEDIDGSGAAVEVTIRGHRFREDFEGAPLRCLDHPEFVVDLESGVEPAMQVGEHVGAPARMPTLVEQILIATGVTGEFERAITGPTPTLAELGLPPVTEFEPLVDTGTHRLSRATEAELLEMGGDEDWAGMDRES